MNIKNPEKYLTVATHVANKMFSLYGNTYLNNSISRKDLCIIAMNIASEVINKYSTLPQAKKGFSLKACIRLSVTGKLYNIINRKCLHHNKTITFLPMEDIVNIAESAGAYVMPAININLDLDEHSPKKDINYFDIKELRPVLTRREYSFVIDYFVKGKSLREIYKKNNFSWFLMAKFMAKVTKTVKKFLIRSNYDLSNYEK